MKRILEVGAVIVVLGVGCSPASERSSVVGASASSGPRAPLPPVRYALTSCPLRYEVRDVDTSRMEGAPREDGEVEVDTTMTLVAQAKNGLLELVPTVSSRPKLSKRRSYDVPVEGYAPVHIETDGARWTERDGPTQVYGALGTIEGLAWFFPDLPPNGEVGALAAWSVVRSHQEDMRAVEATRGSWPGSKEAAARPRAALPPLAPVRLDVRLVRWTEIAGTRVAELEATGTQHDVETTEGAEPLGSMRVVQNATYLGTYAVTAAGRVLRAKVVKDATIELTTTIDAVDSVQHHRQRSVHELALVSACDGPTEPSLQIPLDREEKAIRLWGDARMALAKGEREKVLAAFEPALRTKIGDAALIDALQAYARLRGDQALPPPLLAEDRDIATEGALLRLTTHGATLEAAAHTNHPVELLVSMSGASGAWLIDSLRADVQIRGEKKNLLEISRDRVVVRQGWPPS